MTAKEWTPDTCDCRIVVEDSNYTFLSWSKRCALHKDLNVQPLLDAVMIHNRSFSSRINDTSTDADKERYRQDKKTEVKRILALGTTERK